MSGKAVREVTDILFPGRSWYGHHLLRRFPGFVRSFFREKWCKSKDVRMVRSSCLRRLGNCNFMFDWKMFYFERKFSGIYRMSIKIKSRPRSKTKE
jgi:hypothetical protein